MKIESYKLSFDFDFNGLTFSCHEIIQIRDSESNLALDSAGLDIEAVSTNGKSVQFEVDERAKKLNIRNLASSNKDDDLKLEIDFKGRVTQETLYGVYKSSYGSSYFITTDFEPNGARLMFPCLDDPSYKAVFEIEVTTQKGLTVISNTVARSIEKIDETKDRHIFENTPRMPTYILYLGIGNFEIASRNEDHKEFRVLAKHGSSKSGGFALENASKFIKAYEDYYSIEYPLPKLDLIALPEYASGAMENWGAITFREISLLIDENSSVMNKRRVTSVLGHEIAHQWFGDLVTMSWWNDIWLNESFATFMEALMTDSLYPSWNVLSDFLQQETVGAMLGDSLENTHPIEAEVNAPEEISEIFDEISYGKGASVLRMIESWMGGEAFRAGVRAYLSKYKYSNAKGEDLWRELEKSSRKPVSRVMATWITRPGYPVVMVSLDRNNSQLKLSQERFRLRGDFNSTPDKEEEIWPIPLVTLLNGKSESSLMENEDIVLSLPREGITQIKINAEQSGFYRVLYDEELYSTIRKNFSALSAFDRWGVISDLSAFLLSDRIRAELYFEFVRAARDDADYLVADSISSQLQFLRFLAPDNSSLKTVYLEFHRAQMDRLSLESKPGDRDTDLILRGKIALGLALEDRVFSANLSKHFKSYEKVDPNLRTAVAVAFASTGNDEDSFRELIAAMKRMGNEADLVKIYRALTSFDDPELVRKALDFCVSGEVSRSDSLYCVEDAALNPRARETTWRWFTQNLETFRELFRGTAYVSFLMQDVISAAGIGREEEVRKYLSTVKIEEAEKGIKKGLELMDIYSNLSSRLQELNIMS